jgi:hypothetical protein
VAAAVAQREQGLAQAPGRAQAPELAGAPGLTREVAQEPASTWTSGSLRAATVEQKSMPLLASGRPAPARTAP